MLLYDPGIAGTSNFLSYIHQLNLVPPFVAVIKEIKELRSTVQGNTVNSDTICQLAISIILCTWRVILSFFVERFIAQEEAIFVLVKTVKCFKYGFV